MRCRDRAVPWTDGAGAGWLGQALCSSEAVLGMVLMSLFLVCVARKFSR